MQPFKRILLLFCLYTILVAMSYHISSSNILRIWFVFPGNSSQLLMASNFITDNCNFLTKLFQSRFMLLQPLKKKHVKSERKQHHVTDTSKCYFEKGKMTKLFIKKPSQSSSGPWYWLNWMKETRGLRKWKKVTRLDLNLSVSIFSNIE